MQGRALSCRRASLPLCDESSLNTYGLIYGVPRVYDVFVRCGSRSTRLPACLARSLARRASAEKAQSNEIAPSSFVHSTTRCRLVALSVLGGRKRGRKDPDDGAGEGEGEGLPQVKGISRESQVFSPFASAFSREGERALDATPANGAAPRAAPTAVASARPEEPPVASPALRTTPPATTTTPPVVTAPRTREVAVAAVRTGRDGGRWPRRQIAARRIVQAARGGGQREGYRPGNSSRDRSSSSGSRSIHGGSL